MTVHITVCVLVIRMVTCDGFLVAPSLCRVVAYNRFLMTALQPRSVLRIPSQTFTRYLYQLFVDHVVCTVTCRQFPNLTFAPRKTCHEGSNLTLHRYHATATPIIHGLWQKCKNFFIFFIQTEISYVYPGNSSTKNRPDFRLRSAQWELLQCCESFPL